MSVACVAISIEEPALRAIISDIHANLEALEAVLADIRRLGITEIYCLGDIIGYGPNPCECIDKVMSCKLCLLGNHDQAALFDPEGFNASAERAVFWTRRQLESGTGPAADRRWEFLGELPRVHREPNFLFVHGSARNPLNEYVFPEDIYNQRKMERIFSLVEQYCFQGHTHIPGVFTEDLNFLAPEEIDFKYELGPKKVLSTSVRWVSREMVIQDRRTSYWMGIRSPSNASTMTLTRRPRKFTTFPTWTTSLVTV